MYIVPITRMQPMEPMFETSAAAQAAQGAATPFSDVLSNAIGEMKQAQAAADQDAYDLSMGRVDNLAQVMINSARLSTAVEMTTQLTTRAVTAYREVMQMQV